MNELDQLLQAIDEQRQLAIEGWEGVASQMERDLIDAAFQWINENIKIKDGKLFAEKDLPKKLSKLQNLVIDFVANSDTYATGLNGFLATVDQIQQNMNELNNAVNFINIRDVVKGVQNVVIEEAIDRYTENGLNTHFAAPLRELVYNNALAGMNMKQAKANLIEYIAGGNDKSGKLQSYLTQTAQQAVDTFTGATNMKIQQEFKTVGMIISGSLIETSSKQCVYAVDLSKPTNGFLTNAQWEKVLVIAKENSKARLIEGTTLQNLDINKLHWGCRHRFTPLVSAPKI